MNPTVPQAILLSFCLCLSPSLSYLSLLEIQILYLLCAQKPTLFKKTFIDTITPEIIISHSAGCIVVKCTEHKIHHFNHFKMHNPGASCTFTVLHHHHHYIVPKPSHHPKRKPAFPLGSHSPFL